MRIFLRWDRIETLEGIPDWTCKYTTSTDQDFAEPSPEAPCDGTPCSCGYSADERVAMVAGGPDPMPVMLTLLGTPAWAAGDAATHCPGAVPDRALPLRQSKASAFQAFAAAVARRYGSVAYAFELWNEPDLAGCVAWAGTQQQYRQQILRAASAVKSTGATPGLVVAPTLERPSGDAMDAWMDWSEPVDRLSYNLYTSDIPGAFARMREMNDWCAGNRRRCPGFYITEFGAQRTGASDCPGPRARRPGAADVVVMKRCRKQRWCHGIFLYALSDQNKRPDCDRGLLDEAGCRKRRLCTIAQRVFGVTSLPFTCAGCGP